MVRKYGKGGIRSGNTLRAYNSKFNRVYKRQSYIVKSTQNTDDVDEDILEDWSVNCDWIEYSLNKKGRWVIPRLLKDQILDNKGNYYTGIRATVSESHNIKRSARCVELCSTQERDRHVLPNKKTYFNVNSIGKSNNRKIKSKLKTPYISVTENLDSSNPSLKYEVVYPCPMSSSLMHNRKYVTDHENWREYLLKKKEERRHRGRGNVSRSKYSKFKDQCIEDYELKYIYRDKDDIENEAECSGETECTCGLSEETFSDILFKRLDEKSESGQMILKFGNGFENTKQLRNKKVCNHQTKSGDGKAKLYPEMLPVYVIIPSADTSPHFLKKQYGDSYMECKCFPRKFIIDITDKVYIDKSLDFSAFVVFEYDISTAMDRTIMTDLDVYKVYLNLKSKLKTVQINTIEDFEQMGVDEVIQRTSFFVETISPEYFYSRMHKKRQRGVSKKLKFSTLEACLGKENVVYYPSSEMIRKEIFRGEAVVEKDTPSELGFDFVPPENCPVCFENIISGERSVSALQSCGHWFCNECWMGHITGRASLWYSNLTCPQYQCDALVDRATLMTLVNVDFVQDLATREHDSQVFVNKETKWCTIPGCGRVLKLANISQKSMNVKCVCGSHVCFDCLEQAHWPASCKIAKHYETKLTQSGVKNVSQSDFAPQFTVYGKNCPKCFRFIEKYGGCNHMVCCCGIKFCWVCLKLIATHSLPYCLDTNDKRNAIKIQIRTFIHDYVLKYDNNSELHKTAVRHRACQNPWKTQLMKSNKWILSTKLKRLIAQNLRPTDYISKFDDYLETGTAQETISKIPVFLNCMIDLYLELNYIAEYTAVHLQERVHQYEVLYPVLERMDILSGGIYKIFQSGKHQDMAFVIPELWEIKEHSARCIDKIVKIVSLPRNNGHNSESEFEFV